MPNQKQTFILQNKTNNISQQPTLTPNNKRQRQHTRNNLTPQHNKHQQRSQQQHKRPHPSPNTILLQPNTSRQPRTQSRGTSHHKPNIPTTSKFFHTKTLPRRHKGQNTTSKPLRLQLTPHPNRRHHTKQGNRHRPPQSQTSPSPLQRKRQPQNIQTQIMRRPPPSQTHNHHHPSHKSMRLRTILPISRLRKRSTNQTNNQILSQPRKQTIQIHLHRLSPTLFRRRLPTIITNPTIPRTNPRQQSRRTRKRPRLTRGPQSPRNIHSIQQRNQKRRTSHTKQIIQRHHTKHHIQNSNPIQPRHTSNRISRNPQNLIRNRRQRTRNLNKRMYLLRFRRKTIKQPHHTNSSQQTLNLQKTKPRQPTPSTLYHSRQRPTSHQIQNKSNTNPKVRHTQGKHTKTKTSSHHQRNKQPPLPQPQSRKPPNHRPTL